MLKEFIQNNKKPLLGFIIALAVFGMASWLNFRQVDDPDGGREAAILQEIARDNQNYVPSENSGFVQAPPLQEQKDDEKNSERRDAQSDSRENSQISVSLEVSGQKYSAKIDEGGSVYQLMEKLADENGLRFKAKEFSGIGHFVEEINGVANDPRQNKYWMFAVNGVSSNVGISQAVLKEGDGVLWEYK